MKFQIGKEEVEWEPKRLLIAGYTSKDQEQLQKHIKELEEELGVEPPPAIPMIYDLSPELLTTNDQISVVNNDSSGEAEVIAAEINGQWYIGIGSDHTDRKLESVSVQKSKQVCGKPITSELWPLASVESYWDEIEMKSWMVDKEGQHLYQSGKLNEFMKPEDLVNIIKERNYYSSDSVIFCGTLPLLSEGFIYGEEFIAELYDPIENRSITLHYDVHLLKIAENIKNPKEV
ncbi:DUF2848 family protein [Alteribacillus bidgolensis]|uniref:DUF2848 domain-containing protein n=1 Tax=Alteribacillus bidgolensis TaxID=930129 RepID=A0A1G8HFJ3_9BACI|nr:DUF2848 family protein [Alteribacillus bidgolensis]SDI05413.1 Protein of unknown function [Alteribacillus bidgolensis]